MAAPLTLNAHVGRSRSPVIAAAFCGNVSFFTSRASSLPCLGSIVDTRGYKLQFLHPSSSKSSFVPPVESLRGFRSGKVSELKATGGGVNAALFPFLRKKDKEKVKRELLDAIVPLDRGAEASPDDLARIEKIAQELELLNPTKEPLKSPLLNGKWKLVYTTSETILKKKRPKLLRPNGAIFQAINTDTLRAQNLETWPFFNQVTANLNPVNSKKVVVNFDFFKLGGLISVKAPGRARGELEITYLDDELRVSRGDKGNLFVLVMDDPNYRVPT